METAPTHQPYSGSARYPDLHADSPVPHSTDFFQYRDASRYTYRRAKQSPADRFAMALGWFSVGLGAAELLAPHRMAHVTGMNEHPALMRALGAREIASGVGILSKKRTGNWLWTRVLGDAMDLALLGVVVGTAPSGERRRRASIAAAAVAGMALLDVISGMQQSRGLAAVKVNLAKSIAVNLPVEDCYRFWRNFENFPYFMRHVKDVRMWSETRSHWVVEGPSGTTIEWDADITYDQPNQLLVWHSVEGAEVDHAGQVRFEQASDGRGTIIHVEMQCRPPGGKAGAAVARLFGEVSEQEIEEDIRCFKQLIETGEIPERSMHP